MLRDPSHPEGKRHAPRGDPLRELIEDPNPEDTTGELLYNMALQQALTGTELLWAVPNRWNIPVELYSISTALAIPLPPTQPQYPNGAYRVQPLYPYGPFSTVPTVATAIGAVIPGEQIIRIKNPHPILRYDGYATATAVNLQEDAVEAIDRSRWHTMMRGVEPTAVIEFDPEVENPSEEDIVRIKLEFESLFSGPENAGRALVLMPGTKVNRYSDKPVEMGWTDSWTQLTSFLGAAYGVTKPVAGMIDEANYATLYAALKQFHLLTLQPMNNRTAGALTKHLARRFSPDHFIEIHSPRIDDEELMIKKVTELAKDGGITHNEKRIALGFPPTDEAWGKERAGPPQQQPGGGGAFPGGVGGMHAVEPGKEGGRPEGGGISPLDEGSSPKATPVEAERDRHAEPGGSRGYPQVGNGKNGNGHLPALPERRAKRNLSKLAAEFMEGRAGTISTERDEFHHGKSLDRLARVVDAGLDTLVQNHGHFQGQTFKFEPKIEVNLPTPPRPVFNIMIPGQPPPVVHVPASPAPVFNVPLDGLATVVKDALERQKIPVVNFPVEKLANMLGHIMARQKAPIVNMDTNKLAAAILELARKPQPEIPRPVVEVPPLRPMRKIVQRDGAGRIAEVIEEPM